MKTKVSILLLMLFSVIAASALPHVSTPYKLKRTNPQTRPFEPGAPTDDIVVAMDEEALLLTFAYPQGAVTYTVMNQSEYYVIADFDCESTAVLTLQFTMFIEDCAIVATAETGNSYIIYIEN